MCPATVSNLLYAFAEIWFSLAERGKVDDEGGSQFWRVWQCWRDDDFRSGLPAFILANRIDQAPTDQAAPPSQP